MNIFVLNTGRCGSTTFIKACQHMTNYSALHESRARYIGSRRLAYPANHIEADNRLSWYLGRLDREYGDNAFYVHLMRDRVATAESFRRREQFGIMKAYREGVLMEGTADQSALDIAADYVDTVEANIALFLKDKSNTMEVHLENAKADFAAFWQRIGAQGDLQAALREWDTAHNDSSQLDPAPGA